MEQKKTICLLNDSFPPNIDGVANAVVNYAQQLNQNGQPAIVIAPNHPQAKDDEFPYQVLRYPSVSYSKESQYKAGIPFSPEVARELDRHEIGLLHSHCPIVSTFMARQIRHLKNAPIVLTYHTKFDIEIANIAPIQPLQNACKKALVANISACDDVWVVSSGAGENLRGIGYEGDYIVMHNGVDFPKGRIGEEKVAAATEGYDLPGDVPVYLFVGRLMWYKGIRLIADALTMLKKNGKDFRMVFIGTGDNHAQIEQYIQECGISDRCIFTGPIRDREVLRAWYCRADLFLFPSTFDTNGLVVREAAACSLASVLIQGSCASEGITHGENGFLIDETAESLYGCLSTLSTEAIKTAGENAAEQIYLSWESAVQKASDRYAVVMDRYAAGEYPKNRKPMESILKANGEMMELMGKLSRFRHNKR